MAVTITSGCGEGYTQCRDGTCIRSTNLCDGTVQCLDKSDEDSIFCNGKASEFISVPLIFEKQLHMFFSRA